MLATLVIVGVLVARRCIKRQEEQYAYPQTTFKPVPFHSAVSVSVSASASQTALLANASAGPSQVSLALPRAQ